MGEQEKFEIDPSMLAELGIPAEIIEKIKNSSNPSIHTHAQGGRGGHAINLTYVDNYSTLMLVYTFLLYSSQNQNGNRALNDALLSTLKKTMKEQQDYRMAFLNAVQSLNNQNKGSSS